MSVDIAGAGIGGLAAAQGLRAAGVEVLVLDGDTDLAETGGCRLHLGATATPGGAAVARTPAPVDATAAAGVRQPRELIPLGKNG